MTEGQKSSWLGAGLVVVIILLGVTLWKVVTTDTTKQIAALNTKVEAADAALAKVQAATTTGDIKQQLGELNDKIEKTNAALTELQKGTALKSVADKLEQLNAEIKSTDATLADITKSIPQKGLGDKIEAVSADVKSISGTLASLKQEMSAPQKGLGDKFEAVSADVKSISGTLANLKQDASLAEKISARLDQLDGKLAEIKQTIPAGDDSTKQLTALAGQVKSINDNLARLQQTPAPAGTDNTAALTAALRTELSGAVASLKDAAKATSQPAPSDVVVVYLDMPDTAAKPQTVATVSPLTVQFEKVGSTDTDGQAGMIATKLKGIIKNRKNCTVSVAGYADTLGRDDWNLTISKRRARNIAEKLKTAFAGQDVQINEAAWGERRLKDWTPDETPNAMNRRVDVSVSCKE